jgi:hypothetical protein
MAIKTKSETRRKFGPSKYAAFLLMVSKLLRQAPSKFSYRYITLGGTELKDIQSMFFVDPTITLNSVTFELKPERHALALETVGRLNEKGCKVEAHKRDIFTFFRDSNAVQPHIFFIDLEGICSGADYPRRFGALFANEIMKEGDILLITSYLGRNFGWKRIYKNYDAEFRMLNATNEKLKQQFYRAAHPSFTLYRGLHSRNLCDEIKAECLGCITYFDSSPMAIYGYSFNSGSTDLTEFIHKTPRFNIKNGILD